MSSYEAEELRLKREREEALERKKQEMLRRQQMEMERYKWALHDYNNYIETIKDYNETIKNDLDSFNELPYISGEEKKSIDNHLNEIEQLLDRRHGTSSDEVYDNLSKLKSDFFKYKEKFSICLNSLNQRLNEHNKTKQILSETSAPLLDQNSEFAGIELKKSVDIDQIENDKKNSILKSSAVLNKTVFDERLSRRYGDYIAECVLYNSIRGGLDPEYEPLLLTDFSDMAKLEQHIKLISNKTKEILRNNEIQNSVLEVLREMNVSVHKRVFCAESCLEHYISKRADGFTIHSSFSSKGFVMLESAPDIDVEDGDRVKLIHKDNNISNETCLTQKDFCSFHEKFLKRLEAKGIEIANNYSGEVGQRALEIQVISHNSNSASSMEQNDINLNSMTKKRKGEKK